MKQAGIRTQGPSNLPQLTMEKGIVDFLFLHQNNRSLDHSLKKW